MLPYDDMSESETLGAYVDGELDTAKAADIAARIARDPAMARRAAVLMRLKASAASAFRSDSFVPDLDDPEPLRPATRWRAALATAAAIVVLFTGVVGVQLYSGQQSPDWLTAAAAQHAAMADQPAQPALQLTGLERVAGFQPYIPNLASARLQPVASAPFRRDGSVAPAGIALHFRGTRGCKVTYIAFMLDDTPDLPGEKLAPIDGAGVEGYGWRVGDIGYLLIARGMDQTRLTTLAGTIHEASRKHRLLDDAARTRLADSRTNSRACVA
ncbi:MAG: hypothetical protein VW644_00920 [Alphaproteobacteria bacterium]